MPEYRIVFEKHGELKPEAGLLKNEVWLDVGNTLGMGFFDHHQVKGYESSFSALVHNLPYLDDLRESAGEGKPIIVHMHEEPDLDCVASYFAVGYCLEHSENEIQNFFGEGGKGQILERYINDIDAGRNKVTDYPTLYAIFSLLDAVREKSRETDLQTVERGLELLSVALEELSSPEVDLTKHDFSHRLADAFAREIQLISNSVYEERKKQNIIWFKQIPVWTHGGVMEEVAAAIWKDIPKSYNEYNYARREGAVVTIVPYAIKGRNDSGTSSVFVSVNPDLDPEKRYTLRPIAEIIEQMEQIEEQRLYERDGIYRRDHSRPREASGYLAKMPFAATSDPWYVKPEGDLFDAPRIQSILEYEDILEVILNNGSAVKRSYAVMLDGDMSALYDKELIPLSTWQEEIKQVLKKAEKHVVIWGELDASLIRRSNRLLEAYCLNLIGKPLHEVTGKNIHFIDYRSCIYSDEECTIILCATYKGYNAADLTTAEILQADSVENFRISPLLADIAAIVRQRDVLLECESEIGELKPGKRRETEQINDKMLALSVQMQKDDRIENVVEREIYSYIKEEFGIPELKESVMNDLGIIVGESRDRFISKFNNLSAFAVPFILIATVFQMGFLKFEEAISLTGRCADIGWIAVAILVAVLMLVIVRMGGRDDQGGG